MKYNNIKLSIIIPVYNGERYIRQCLESAIAQTIREKEILCVDDGSTDHTWDIIKEFSAKYAYIKYYSQKNQGAGIARNYGMQMAQGEFVAFLDADDYYLAPDALEKMYVACIQNGAYICGSFRSREIQGQVLPMELHRKLFGDCEKKGCWLKYSEYQEDYHYHNYIYSLQMLRNENIVFPNYRRYQDAPFLVKAMIKAENFYIVPVELYCYRENVQSMERKKTYIDDTLRGMIDNLESAVKNNLHILHNITVGRINNEYYQAIIENAFHNNFEVLDLLRQANQLVHWEWLHNHEQNELMPLTMIKKMQDARYFTERYDEIKESHKVVSMWLNSFIRGNHIEDYLKRRNIKNVAIYGYGFLGEMLYRELRKTQIAVKYIIDKRNISGPGLKVVSPESEWENVDAIIISPLSYIDILEKKSSQFRFKIFVLKNILMEMEESSSEKEHLEE